MCYSTNTRLLKEIQYAKERFEDEQRIIKLEQLLLELGNEGKAYFANGFSHPKLMVFTDKEPSKPQLFSWGLIPSWTKSEVDAKKNRVHTLNARGETIWEKPSFRLSAKDKRCLIYVDSFFENHHQGKEKYPFRIMHKDERPMILGGLWDEWVNKETGEVINSVTIVTTTGNELLSKIHNNPAAEMGPRMPVIISKEKQEEWLSPCKSDSDKIHIAGMIKPFDEDSLKAYSVPKLLGKTGVGNSPRALEHFEYPELKVKV